MQGLNEARNLIDVGNLKAVQELQKAREGQRRPPLVLVADDAAHLRLLCTQTLAAYGIVVIEAEDGIDAIEKYQQHRPDAVLLDISMPRLDGLDALKEIKRLDPEAKVCMVSAQAQQNKVVDALLAGARDFVVKPFEMQRLVRSVQKLLR